MPDTERRKTATSLRHGTHESRTTGHVTSEERRNSEEDRRNEEIAQRKKKKKELYEEHLLKIWTDGTTVLMSLACVSVPVTAGPWAWRNIGTEVTAASFNGNVRSNKAPNYAALRILLYTPRNKTGHLQFPLRTQQIPTNNYVFTATFLISWYLLCESLNHRTVPMLSLMNPVHMVTLHSLQVQLHAILK